MLRTDKNDQSLLEETPSLTSREVFRLPSDLMIMLTIQLSIKDVVALSAVDRNLNMILTSVNSRTSQSYWKTQCQLSNVTLFNPANVDRAGWLDKFKKIPAILDVCRLLDGNDNPSDALIYAIKNTKVKPKFQDLALRLISLGVNTSISDKFSESALFHAVNDGNNVIIEALLRAGDDANGELGKACNPINVATYFGHVETTLLLVKNGADINDALIFACRHDKLKIAEELLKMGACLNTFSKLTEGFYIDMCPFLKETTALVHAVFNGHKNIVKFLLDNGADPLLKGKSGYNAVDFLHEKTDPDIIELLDKYKTAAQKII
jgi:ankyrin repeat protein